MVKEYPNLVRDDERVAADVMLNYSFASGGMVLVLDDMWDAHLHEISVRGVCLEMIERLASLGLASYPR
jgi:hypothetical protein